MSISKVRYINTATKTLGITIPHEIADALRIQKGDILYIDWIHIKKETENVLTFSQIPKTVQTEETTNGRKERTSNDISSRSGQSNDMEKHLEDEGWRSPSELSTNNEIIQGQRQPMAGNEPIQTERPAEVDPGSTEGIRIRINEFKERRNRLREI